MQYLDQLIVGCRIVIIQIVNVTCVSMFLPNKQPPTTRDQSILEQSMAIQVPIPLSSLESIVLSIKKSDNSIRTAQKFCLQNNLDFNMINPISQRIDLLLKADESSEKCTMRHIDLDGDEKENISQSLQFTGGIHARSKEKLRESLKPGLNAGVMIYERNRRLNEKSKRKNQELKQAFEAEISKQLTFKPEISSLSRIVVDQIEESEGREEFYERRRHERMSRISCLQKQQEREEMRECSFQPITNESRMSSTKSFSNSRYLSNLSKPKNTGEKVQDVENKSFTFHPKINPVSEMIIGGVTFEERQQKYQIERMMRTSKLGEERPSIRSSRCIETEKLTSKRNLQKLPIGEYLYNQRYNKQISVQRIKRELRAKPIQSIDKSSEIHEANKFRSYYQIFRILDSDGDSIISPSRMDAKGLPSQILNLIAPILAQMEQLSFELNEEQFIEALHKLYSTLNVSDRNTLIRLGRGGGQETGERYSFKPQINERSSILGNKVREFGAPGVSLYDFCEQRKSLLDKKLEDKRRERANNLSFQCTFKPLINK